MKNDDLRIGSRVSARLHSFFARGGVEGWQLGASGSDDQTPRNRPAATRRRPQDRPGNRLLRVLIIGAVLINAFIGYVSVDPYKQFDGPKRTIAEEWHNTTYDRHDYKHWVDADKDCQDTRQEVLIAESTTPVKMDAKGCRVVSGTWQDPFTGETFTNPRQMDIDHMVPLKEAHRSGAHGWDAARREAYANDMSDPRSLIAVSAGANRSKGDRDPANWLPTNSAYLCDYVINWQNIKIRWELSQDPAEAAAIDKVIKDNHCPADNAPPAGQVKNSTAPMTGPHG